MAQAKNLTSTLRLQGATDALVRTDALLLQRIVMNICQNALKFTQQGHIELLVSAHEQSVEIAISDTGCGIAPELQNEVFQEFFQVANHERDASMGMGLGLSIVQRLCSLLEIQIQLESELGRGTTVHLRMRRSPDHRSAPRAARGSPPLLPQPLFKHHVLVVDDEVAVRQAAQFLLQELGCSVDACEDLEGARQLCQKRRPDVMLVDLRLRGDLNGVELLKSLRQEFGAIPALLVTGDTSPDRLRLASEAGIPLCHKPLSAEKLTKELALLLPE
jgi:CheY-like chemotaxis protein